MLYSTKFQYYLKMINKHFKCQPSPSDSFQNTQNTLRNHVDLMRYALMHEYLVIRRI